MNNKKPNMQAIDPLIQTMADRNALHNEVIRLRAILGSFKENLEAYLEITQREYDSYNHVRALESLSKLGSIKHMRDCLKRLEASTI
jgi:hypothetical protein